MVDYNFTIRATDNMGSFADRAFSMSIRNTRIERYMVVNNTNAWTSPDGSFWALRAGFGGFTCAYGNGFWLILRGSTSAITGIYKSTDGVNYAPTAVASMVWKDDSGATVDAPVNNTNLKCLLKFFKGKFYFTSITSGSGGAYDLWSSADGITWQRKRLFQSTANDNNYAPTFGVTTIPSIVLSEDNGTLIVPFPGNSSLSPASSSAYGWTTTDGATFTPVRDAAFTGVNFAYALNRVNGLWIAQYVNGRSTASAYRYSTDGVNWTAGSLPSLNTTTYPVDTYRPGPIFYANGRFFAFSQGRTNSTDAGIVVYRSNNGVSWFTPFAIKPTTNGTDGTTFALHRNGLYLAAGATAVNTFDNTAGATVATGGIRSSLDGTNYSLVSIPGNPTSFNDLAAM